jgi:transcriptional regulator with GAF, ATPase, and Fis domain
MMTEERTEATAITADESHRKLRLLVLAGDAPHVFELPRNGTVTVGRSRECEARIEHTSVSRKHVILHLVDGAATLEDLGSANGTKIGGKPIALGSRAAITPGTIFEIGKVRAVLAYPTTPRGAEGTPMEQTRQLIGNVAKGTISVLLVGETGAGKEVMAREIHERSPRSSMPFVAVNCAALPENLLESELFGYEKGAFTGAAGSKVGLFESANGGTVLLDEIGDMPLATQAKVLRILETRQVTPLGSVRPKSVDVRFIAATNRDLDALVKSGDFRDDLLFRISGVTIRVPPLRERSDEIASLAEKLLGEECARAKVAEKSLSPQAIALLESYAWPGNVRELRSAMERAALLAPDVVGAEHLLLGQAKSGGVSTESIEAHPSSSSIEPNDERTRIEAALERSGGNQKEAAKLLGITRRALMYRMDRYGLKRPRKRTE